MRLDLLSDLPPVVEEQALRPIGAEHGDVEASCKMLPDAKVKSKRPDVCHNLDSGDGQNLHEALDNFSAWVDHYGVTSLHGSTINLEEFKEKLPAAVAAGLVDQLDCDYILNGLEFGFDLHVDESKLPGKKVWRNFKSAYSSKSKVHDALIKRVTNGKQMVKLLDLASFMGNPVSCLGFRVAQFLKGRCPRGWSLMRRGLSATTPKLVSTQPVMWIS